MLVNARFKNEHKLEIYFDTNPEGNQMRHTILVTSVLVLTLAACDKKPSQEPFVPTPAIESSGTLPPGHPPVESAGQTTTLSGPTESPQTQTATVLTTIQIPQFTYIEVKQNDQKRWLAASTIDAQKGDTIEFDAGSTISDFKSKALDRSFPNMTFVNNATIKKAK